MEEMRQFEIKNIFVIQISVNEFTMKNRPIVDRLQVYPNPAT